CRRRLPRSCRFPSSHGRRRSDRAGQSVRQGPDTGTVVVEEDARRGQAVTGFVLDASVAVAWCFDDESTPAAWALLDQLRGTPAHVPALWTLEVGNILLGAEKRRRITQARTIEFLGIL